jgi:hypothetical protein
MMKRSEILKMALDAGIGDPDLSSKTRLVTDYGDSAKGVLNFHQIVQQATAEECAELCEKIETRAVVPYDDVARGFNEALRLFSTAIRAKFDVWGEE